jgi:hypothetical protein
MIVMGRQLLLVGAELLSSVKLRIVVPVCGVSIVYVVPETDSLPAAAQIAATRASPTVRLESAIESSARGERPV